MLLTPNEHLQFLEHNGRINWHAANCVLYANPKNPKLNPEDKDNLESQAVEIMIDAMSATHIAYPQLHEVMEQTVTDKCDPLKKRIKATAYKTIKAAYGETYFPPETEAAWLTLMVMYADTYYTVLTGKHRPNGKSMAGK